MATAKLVGVWETSVLRTRRRKEEEVEQSALDLPKKIHKSDHIVLRKSYFKVHEEIPSNEIPHPTYIEKKLTQIGDGEVTAERLSDVVSLKDSPEDMDELGLVLKAGGMFKPTRVSTVKGTLPAKPEELRSKLTVMANMWEFVRLKLPTSALFADYDAKIWDTHVKWLLGEDVYECSTEDDTGAVTYRPRGHSS